MVNISSYLIKSSDFLILEELKTAPQKAQKLHRGTGREKPGKVLRSPDLNSSLRFVSTGLGFLFQHVNDKKIPGSAHRFATRAKQNHREQHTS